MAALIGDEAESLVYKFCSIDRQLLEQTVLEERTIRRDGYVMRHIHTGAALPLSASEAVAMVTETLADEVDQRFGWQSDLESGLTMAAWPGPALPTLRLSRTSRLAHALRRSGLPSESCLPPIFARCSAVLDPADEARARDAYWRAISPTISQTPPLPPEAHAAQWREHAGTSAEATGASPGARESRRRRSGGSSSSSGGSSSGGGDGSGAFVSQLRALREASELNPFVAEPHIVRAQCLLQLAEWEAAEMSAAEGVRLLCCWGTQWDK